MQRKTQRKIDTAVIIVNWNGQELLFDCLDSLRKQTYYNFKIILVDNGSVDNSVKYVQNNFLEVKIIELNENTGFAKGNNIGISEALKNTNIKNVVLLNNDTKVKSNFLEKLINAINSKDLNKQYKKIGALAPKILLWKKKNEQCLVNSKREINIKKNDEVTANGSQYSNSWKSGSWTTDCVIDAIGASIGLDGRGYGIGNSKIDEGQYNKVKEVFGICGGATLIKRATLEDILENNKWRKFKTKNNQILKYQEYFDDNFFAYYEDTDLSWRIRLKEWQIITVPEAIVWHIHSATKTPSSFKAYYLNRNRFLMMLKNFPWKFLWKGLLLTPKSYFKFTKTNKSKKYIQGNKTEKKIRKKTIRKIKIVWVMVKVSCNLLFNFPKVFWQRRSIQKNKIASNRKIKGWFLN